MKKGKACLGGGKLEIFHVQNVIDNKNCDVDSSDEFLKILEFKKNLQTPPVVEKEALTFIDSVILKERDSTCQDLQTSPKIVRVR